MNKHLKCVLKLMGTPIIFLITVVLTIPLLFLFITIELSGCMDVEKITSPLLEFPEWYKRL